MIFTGRGLSVHCRVFRLSTAHPGGGHTLPTPPTNTKSSPTSIDT